MEKHEWWDRLDEKKKDVIVNRLGILHMRLTIGNIFSPEMVAGNSILFAAH